MFVTISDETGTTTPSSTFPPLGQAAAAASLPVVHATDDPIVTAFGTPATPAYSDPSLSAVGTLIALLKGLFGATASKANIADGGPEAVPTGTATKIVAARAGRDSVLIVNETTNAMRVGSGDVTATKGMLLPGVVGASVNLRSTADIYAVAISAQATVSFLETF